MKHFCCLKNVSGQALVETLFSLPILVAGGTLVLGGLHSLSAFYLTDYWTYDLAFCLAQERSTIVCRKQFKRKVANLPLTQVSILESRNFSGRHFVKTQMTTTAHEPMGPSR